MLLYLLRPFFPANNLHIRDVFHIPIYIIAFFIAIATIYYKYILNSAFYTDDWSTIGIINSYSPANTWEIMLQSNPRRPIMWIFYWVILGNFQHNPTICVLISLFLISLQQYLIFTILRLYNIENKISLSIIFFITLCPLSDSTRMWFSGSVTTLSIVFLLLGYLYSIKSYNLSNIRISKKYAFASLAFYVMAGMTYEATLPFLGLIIISHFVVNLFFSTKRQYHVAPLIALTLLLFFFYSRLGPSVQGYQVPNIAYILSRVVIFTKEFPKALSLLFIDASGQTGFYIVIITWAILFAGPWGRFKIEKILILTGWIIVIFGYLPFLLAPSPIHPLAGGWGNRCNSFSLIGLALIFPTTLFLSYRLLKYFFCIFHTYNYFLRKSLIFAFLCTYTIAYGHLAISNINSQKDWILAGLKSNEIISSFKENVIPLMNCGQNDSLLATNIPLAVSDGIFVYENPSVLTMMLRSISKCKTATAIQIDSYRLKNCLINDMTVSSFDGGNISSIDKTPIKKYRYGENIGFINTREPKVFFINNHDDCLKLGI